MKRTRNHTLHPSHVRKNPSTEHTDLFEVTNQLPIPTSDTEVAEAVPIEIGDLGLDSTGVLEAAKELGWLVVESKSYTGPKHAVSLTVGRHLIINPKKL